MKIPSIIQTVTVGLAITALANTLVSAAESLDEHLEPLRPFLGKTWKAEFKNSTPEKPQQDIARWERALNGHAVRVLHSINHGEYGGETLIIWDATKKSLVYHYFTTAGYMTTGTMTIEGGKFISHEKVSGEAGGISEVKATSQMRPDGTLHSKALYLKNGQWVDGHEFLYHEDAKAEVRFH